MLATTLVPLLSMLLGRLLTFAVRPSGRSLPLFVHLLKEKIGQRQSRKSGPQDSAHRHFGYDLFSRTLLSLVSIPSNLRSVFRMKLSLNFLQRVRRQNWNVSFKKFSIVGA